MKDLKTFINKDIIKRMRHNKEHQLLLLWPDSINQVKRIESLPFIYPDTDKCKSKEGRMIFFLTKEQMNQVIPIEKLTDYNCEVWKITDSRMTKEELKELFMNSNESWSNIIKQSKFFEKIYLSEWDS